jgi:NOL1/NOP2/fmu family ribosome biogenesis protein
VNDRPNGGSRDGKRENVGERFGRLPATADERVVTGRPTREGVLAYFEERFGIPRATFDGHTFWEKGAGKLWAYAGEADSPVEVEALGITLLRTRQEHWKPTTSAALRFGGAATENVIDLREGEAGAFVRGHDQRIEWDGDWGYLIAAHRLAGEREPLGVGLYLHGELRSVIPKGRQWD